MRLGKIQSSCHALRKNKLRVRQLLQNFCETNKTKRAHRSGFKKIWTNTTRPFNGYKLSRSPHLGLRCTRHVSLAWSHVSFAALRNRRPFPSGHQSSSVRTLRVSLTISRTNERTTTTPCQYRDKDTPDQRTVEAHFIKTLLNQLHLTHNSPQVVQNVHQIGRYKSQVDAIKWETNIIVIGLMAQRKCYPNGDYRQFCSGQ